MEITRPTIGLCLIAKDEEDNIERLYESVKGCFDEIYLTDTGSTDQTVPIAERLGMTVSHFKWVDDFAAARNFSFAQAKTDYVCWLDLDDCLINKESFIHWRDSVMGLGDMWLAKYDYASNENGDPICTFARERVIKSGLGLRWKYFIHEGILPTNGRKIMAQYATTWKVKHLRTDKDLQKDQSRNLAILEKNLDKLDARMKYYYGKELFENKREFDSIKWLVEAAADKTLEQHDRILAIQYACYAYMKVNQFEKAVDIAFTGLQYSPQRAEFLTVLGDCYIKMNRPMDAAPYYFAAKNCMPVGLGAVASPIFSTADHYNVYPTNQIARIYANTGRIDDAILTAKDGFEKHNNMESKAILDECLRIKSLCSSFVDAKPCDDIVISCPPNAAYKWDGKIYREKAMGGSETAAIEMAEWLHKISGRTVKIFNVRDDALDFNGVEYRSTNQLNEYMSKNKPWLHIAWRHNIKITNAPTFLYSHDLVTPGVEAIDNYTKVLALTPFHRNYLHVTQGVPLDKIYVTRNGVVPEKFLPYNPDEKDPNMFVFSSSPDRGLDRAMRVLDRVREKYPDITLHLFYGRSHLDKYGLKDMRVMLDEMVKARPWVIDHGSTEQSKMYEYFRKAAYCVQPSDFIETSKITAREMLYCGIYQITRAVGGVVDTMRDAAANGLASLLYSDCISESEYQRYIDETIAAMDEQRYKRIKSDANEWAWEAVAQEWLKELPKMM